MSYMDNNYSESRVYFWEGKVIKALLREKNQEDEKTKLSSVENIDNPDFKNNNSLFETNTLEFANTALERLSQSK